MAKIKIDPTDFADEIEVKIADYLDELTDKELAEELKKRMALFDEAESSELIIELNKRGDIDDAVELISTGNLLAELTVCRKVDKDEQKKIILSFLGLQPWQPIERIIKEITDLWIS